MLRTRNVALPFLSTLGLAALLGCGANLSAPSSSVPVNSNLGGNWLLAGSLPTFSNVLPPVSGFNLAVTLDETSSGVTGGGAYGVYCTNFGYGGGWGFSPATFTSGGNFTLQQTGPSTDNSSIEVMGTASSNGQLGWSGAYTFSSDGAGCPISLPTQFTATRIQNLTGTFSGSAAMTANSEVTQIPVIITAVLQQGGVSPKTGEFSNLPVTGTVQISGLPCASAETYALTTADGQLAGDSLVGNATSPDGATLFVAVNIANTDATELYVQTFSVSGGQCTVSYNASSPTLVKQ